MNISLNSSLDVFLFIIFCSVYVCSILWIYGDAATRGAGWKGLLLPLLFIVAGTLALILGISAGLAIWPLAYIGWFIWRPPPASHQ